MKCKSIFFRVPGLLLKFLLIINFLASPVYAANLLIVFDQTLQPTASLQAEARSQMILRSLKTLGVKQAVFLIDTYDLDEMDKQRISLYSQAGHLLVTKGHNQEMVSRKNVYSMQANILKSDARLAQYPGYKRHVHLDWLNEAWPGEQKNKMIEFLTEKRFKPASSGNLLMRGFDEYLNELYQKRKKQYKPVNMEKLQKVYLEVVLKDLQFNNAIASWTLGYSPVQILTLQENDVTAYCLLALLDELEARGWNWIEAEKAYADPVMNPYGSFGFGATGYKKMILPFMEDHAAYARVIGNRKDKIDRLLQAELPELLQ